MLEQKDKLALQRLHMMGDWLRIGRFDAQRLFQQLQPFESEWKPYNPRKKINRFGLSVTSLDGKLSGIPDLDSLGEYNRLHGTSYQNSDFKALTPVFEQCSELQKIISPYLPWLGRCHFIRLDKGGYFPEHYDNNKLDWGFEEIRMIAFIHKNSRFTYKFCYNDQLMNFIADGDLYYFNANKNHSVFSFADNCIQLVMTLTFDSNLFSKILETCDYS